MFTMRNLFPPKQDGFSEAFSARLRAEAGEARRIVAVFIRALAVARRSRLTDSDSIAKPATPDNG
jgi:hypothetical protein